MRIGFLFNHDQIHQIAHSLPIALAIARQDRTAEVIVATTNARLAREVIRLCGPDIHRVTLMELDLSSVTGRMLAGLLGRALPARKLLVYRDHLDFFRSLDVLVVAEKSSLILKQRYGLDKLTIIHTRHGAGDRAIGFDAASAGFDHILVSGEKIRDRLIKDAKVDPRRISIVGYPKFDLSDGSAATHPLIDDGRPVVLYNPHVSPHLSSWYKMGRRVLDWFVEHDEYQLIFAPHVMLFERPFVITIDRLRIDRPGGVDKRHLRASNIHIDLGGRASTTMAYTNRADIYLGDVSSQVYEFIAKPRPCVFLNAHKIDWVNDPNYAHWTAGPVIADIDDLGPALDIAISDNESAYKPVQERLLRYTFDLTEESSSDRAARAIMTVARAARGSHGRHPQQPIDPALVEHSLPSV
jgi:hypothetical protein